MRKDTLYLTLSRDITSYTITSGQRAIATNVNYAVTIESPTLTTNLAGRDVSLIISDTEGNTLTAATTFYPDTKNPYKAVTGSLLLDGGVYGKFFDGKPVDTAVRLPIVIRDKSATLLSSDIVIVNGGEVAEPSASDEVVAGLVNAIRFYDLAEFKAWLDGTKERPDGLKPTDIVVGQWVHTQQDGSFICKELIGAEPSVTKNFTTIVTQFPLTGTLKMNPGNGVGLSVYSGDVYNDADATSYSVDAITYKGDAFTFTSGDNQIARRKDNYALENRVNSTMTATLNAVKADNANTYQAMLPVMNTTVEARDRAEAAAQGAKSSETRAVEAETRAATSEANALAYKNSAAASEENAGLYRQQALASAQKAEQEAVTATTKASEAASSASKAAASANEALYYKNSAETFSDSAESWSHSASEYAAAADTSADLAKMSEDNATSSAANAATSESNAMSYKNTAVASADLSTTNKNSAADFSASASASASAAASSATAAANSAAAAAQSAQEAAQDAAQDAAEGVTEILQGKVDAAEAAQAAAETAQKGAEAAKEAAAQSATAAETAKADAQSAAAQAASSAGFALAAKTEAQSAATAAQAAHGKSEAAQAAAETAKADAEASKTASASSAKAAAESAYSAASSETAAAESANSAKASETAAAESATSASASATAANASANAASSSATAAGKSADAAAKSATAAAKSADDLAATSDSVGFLLVKPGCPINIEERDGAICSVRCMGQDRFMPACDGVYYSITNGNSTYFLSKNLNVVKKFSKTFGLFSYHDYAMCGSGTLVVRNGLIWYSSGSNINVVDWESGNALATLAGYSSIVHNGLSGNMVAVASNGLTACVVTYDQASGAIVAGEAFETGFPFTETWRCRVHPFHMGKFVLVSLLQQYDFLGDKIYALDANDRFVEISADTGGGPILFNCTASKAGFTGDDYKYEYAAKNPAFYWFRDDNATDASGASFATFAMTNGLLIWRVNGTTEDGVPTFAKFGDVKGYPWQASSALRRIPVAISCGTRPDGGSSGYFYGSLLSGSMQGDNKHVPHTIKATIPFSQTSSGGIASSITIEETKSTNLYGNFPVCPLKGSPFSFGGNWGYNNAAPGLMVDLRNPLTF